MHDERFQWASRGTLLAWKLQWVMPSCNRGSTQPDEQYKSERKLENSFEKFIIALQVGSALKIEKYDPVESILDPDGRDNRFPQLITQHFSI